jgi:type VI secretion system protein ImpL
LALPPQAQPLDEQLIASTRQILTRIPVAQQLYQRIKQEALQNHEEDFKLADALGPNGSIIFATAAGKFDEQAIPGLFTYNGFYRLFLNESKNVAKQTSEQKWVLGDSRQADAGDPAALESKLRSYYYIDFIKHWDDLLGNLRIRQAANIQQSIEILEAASGAESPLRLLLQAIDQQTSLTRPPPSSGADAADKLKEGAEKAAGNARIQKLLNTAKLAGLSSESEKPPGQEVEQHFQNLTASVKNTGGSAPIDQIIADLGQLYTFMAGMGSTSDTGTAAGDKDALIFQTAVFGQTIL